MHLEDQVLQVSQIAQVHPKDNSELLFLKGRQKLLLPYRFKQMLVDCVVSWLINLYVWYILDNDIVLLKPYWLQSPPV